MWPLWWLVVASGLALFGLGISKLLDHLGLGVSDQESIAKFEKARRTTGGN